MHIGYADVVARMVEEDWGQKFKSKEDAARHMIASPEKIGAFATVELLRRLNRVARAIGSCDRNRDEDVLEIPDDAAVFPAKKIGEFLYTCDGIEEGVRTHVIVCKDDAGHCLIVTIGDFDKFLKHSGWRSLSFAYSDAYATIEEAIQAQARHSEQYYEKRAAAAKAALQAIANGDCLDRFVEGIEFEDEEEAT